MRRRRICIITGARAEYDLLRPLIEEVSKYANLQLQLIVTGMHLSSEFGLTYKGIEEDGIAIDEKIKILLYSDTPLGISKTMGLGLARFAKAYQRLRPDIIVVLGDRFEIFSAVSAAAVSRIAVAHINGGEVTVGAFDDYFRHSITKMSHLHFTSTEEYRKRVIQLGENPKRVFNVGALSLDNIKRLNPLSKRALERELNFKFNKHNLLVTFHPVTLEKDTSKEEFHILLKALERLRDTNIIFTKANADPGGRVINWMIDKYTKTHPSESVVFTSMGQRRYLSVMRYVDAVVGNSSSGIVEAPSFKIGTINIGDRQRGRIKVESIIDCAPTKEAISKAIKRLYSKQFQKKLKKRVINPYGDGNAAKRIVKVLTRYSLSNILKKGFYDVDTKKIKGW